MKRKQLLALVLVIAMMIGIMPGAKALSFGGDCPSPYNHGSHFSPTNVPICFWCGYNGCTHANNKWDDKKDSSVLPVYQIENEQNHRVISSYKRYCKDCGAYMKNVTDDGKLEGHNFTNGDTCICGYKKPVCNHNFIWEDIYDSSVLPVYQIVNEQNHRVFSSYKRYCVECGEHMKNVTDDGVLKAHNFTNGDTCICGYKKPVCTHSNGNWNDVYDSSVQPVYQIENDQYHRIFNSYKRYCKDCNQYVKNVSDNGARRSHIFPNGDTCICGYKKPMTGGDSQHVGVSAKIDTEYRQYSNAAAHQKRDVYGYTCSVCSETIIERYTEWIDENHKDSGQGWCLYCGAAVGAANDEAYPIITNLSVSPNAAGMSTPISVSGLVDGNGGTIARVRVSVFYNDSLTSGKVYKDYEVNSSTFDLSTVGTIVPGATLAQDGTLLIPDKGSYSLAVFATNTNGKGQGDSPALCGFTVGSCTHSNYGYDLNGKGRTVKLDNEKHLYTFPVIYYCTICGERWNGTESTEGEHSLSMKTEYEELNSAFHLVKKSLVCSAGCGMKKEVEVTTGNHTFDDAVKCTACDYIKAGNQYVVHYTFFKKNGTGSPVSASGNQINVEITDEEQYYLTIGVSCTENGEAIWRQPGTGKGIGYKFVTNSDVLSFVNDAQAKLNKAGTASVDFVDPDGEILTTFTVNVADKYITGEDTLVDERLVELARQVYSDDGGLSAELNQLPSDKASWLYDGAKSLGTLGFGLIKRGYDEITNDPYIDIAKANLLNSLIISSTSEDIDSFMAAVIENQNDVLSAVKETNSQIKIVTQGENIVVEYLSNNMWVELPITKSLLGYISNGLKVCDVFRKGVANANYRLDEIYTVAMICANYETSKSYLEDCISESSDTLKTVYEKALDDLDATYSAVIENKLDDFASGEAEKAAIDFDLFIDIIDTGMKISTVDGNPAKNAMLLHQIKEVAYQTALENASAGATGSTVANAAETSVAFAEKSFKCLMWAYTLTSVIADYPLKGKDMYSAVDEIYTCIDIIDDMCADLEKAISKYISNPISENKMALAAKTIALADVRIQALNACISYEKSRVLVQLEDKIGSLIWQDTTGWIESRCASLNQDISRLNGIKEEVGKHR